MTNNSVSPPYNKPPIIEAVIAIHFATPLADKEIDTFSRKLKKAFPFSEDIIVLQATYNARTKEHVSNIQKLGYKLSSADRTRLIMIQAPQFGVIQQAPYSGWDTFNQEARTHWDALTKIVGRKPISRVSTRYINRIDIPVGATGVVDLHKYFHVGLSLPDYAKRMSLQTFAINSSLLNSSEQYVSVLQVAAAQSPLIDHLSFTIDIDIATTGPVEPRDDKLWELIGTLRKRKNDLFEACITQDTRNLFQ
jgi:uncharacterized protein (TIGR04255 family)